MTAYKFTCTDEQDFLIKCRYAKAKDSRLKNDDYKKWFAPDWDLTGPNNVWVVDEYGILYCSSPSYADPDAINISCINSINVGDL